MKEARSRQVEDLPRIKVAEPVQRSQAFANACSVTRNRHQIATRSALVGID